MTDVIVDVGNVVMVGHGALGKLGPAQQGVGLMMWDAGAGEGNSALLFG